MKRSDQDCLLKALLTGDDLSSFRQRSLEATLRSIRQEGNRRHALAGVTLVALLAMAGILVYRALVSWEQRVATASRPQEVGEIKFITDEELLALFPDRPVALIGKPGQQHLVFLDFIRDRERSDSPYSPN